MYFKYYITTTGAVLRMQMKYVIWLFEFLVGF